MREASGAEATIRVYAEALGRLLPRTVPLSDALRDLVWSMNGPEYYLLVTGRGRSPEEYARLVADVWTRTFLV